MNFDNLYHLLQNTLMIRIKNLVENKTAWIETFYVPVCYTDIIKLCNIGLKYLLKHKVKQSLCKLFSIVVQKNI